ncbi:hypothetical protein KSD_82330 [Ktedonobacter sp. SOSP1-85]|uniref:hypothetical protein n=1 Tax=Ktedonobacter sp. SOSP1-85 TaxID=2778367 RepID=UPI001915A21F|nr:hypothetical protein [Ktedonobacter sp. SOSP1-85]GHO80462.1 hypothetical protein KSD_82330 [Ktedonobacter sp. SOSP1-85]
MASIVDSSVHIHTSAELAPCSPPWFGEVVLLMKSINGLDGLPHTHGAFDWLLATPDSLVALF